MQAAACGVSEVCKTENVVSREMRLLAATPHFATHHNAKNSECRTAHLAAVLAPRVAALGYTGIELLADVPHAWPAGLLDKQKQAIRDALSKHKLTISNINAFMMNAIADPRQPYWHPGWTDPDPHYRAIRREIVQAAQPMTEIRVTLAE